MGRLIIYGDIHGCYEELVSLRKKIGITKDDTEVCVGDIVNKGKDSIKVLDLLIEKNIQSVLGNNEEKLLRYLEHEKSNKKNPIEIDESYIKKLSDKHKKYLANMPLYLKINDITILHGGVQNHMNLKKLLKREKEKILRLRYLDKNGHFLPLQHNEKITTFWADIYDGHEGFIVYGHQPFDDVRFDKYALGLDTGCVYGGKLSAAVFNGKNKPKIFQVEKL